MELEGKNLLISGGANGLGRGMVVKLLEEGAQVGVLDLDRDGLKQLSTDFKDVITLPCDLTKADEVEQHVTDFFGECGRIDGLINNAGVLFSAPLVTFGPSGFQRHSLEDWERILSINLTAVFHLSSIVVEKMLMKRTKGVIVNISSVSAQGNAGQSAYSAAKAGINALTAVWAKELSMMGIRVAAVAPGFIDMPSTRIALSEKVLSNIESKIPLRRLGQSEEIVEAVLMVLKNDYYNGKVLEIDGGMIV